MTTAPVESATTWTEAARKVLAERYLLPNETPDALCARVAAAVAAAEDIYDPSGAARAEMTERFTELLQQRDFLPNTPTLVHAGRNTGMALSACYVLPVPDSLAGIFEAVRNAALAHQSGGGTGFSFSRLRPAGSPVRAGGVASGPVSFLRVFDAATAQIRQGGVRRGANMGVLDVHHPDILEFIDCKRDGGITNFNISVGISDRFMRALEENTDYDLYDPQTDPPQVAGRLSAQVVWKRICEAAWATGDPGLVFLDRVNASRCNPVPELGPIRATNPCGEEPIYDNDSCNLGSINLAHFVRENELDLERLARTTALAVRFLDNVIDINPYPLPEVAALTRQIRRIGLGVMGWADALFLLGIPYDSDPARALAGVTMRTITSAARDASAALAATRGPFPLWSRSIYAQDRPYRNAAVTTVAPTGSISIIAGCSSGIEPVYALAYRHNNQLGRTLDLVNPLFVQIAQRAGWYTEEVAAQVAATGSVRACTQVPEHWRRVFATAHELSPEAHIAMQAAFQAHTEQGISKTVNLPHEATPEQIAQVYRYAYTTGCFGVTVFRDGSKVGVLSTGTSDQPTQKRPAVVQGYTRRIIAPEGNVYVTLNRDPNGLFEVFLNGGKTGSDMAAMADALGRLISLFLRTPGPVARAERQRALIEQLRGIGGSRTLGFGPDQVRSLPDAVAHALALDLLSEPSNGVKPRTESQGDLCPECASYTLVYEEGCRKCPICGFSSC